MRIEFEPRTKPAAGAVPIQSLWIGPSLGPIECMTIRSYLHHGHPFHLYAYDEISNLPDGTTVLDAGAVLGRNEVFANEGKGFGAGSFSPFSNIFRSTLLREKGGWWVDMDVVCLRPFLLEQPNVIATSQEWGWGQLANVNVIKFEKAHPLLDLYLELIRKRYSEKVAHGIGPTTMQLILRDHPEFNDYLVPPDYFNPIGWQHAKYLVQPEEPIWSKRRISRLLRRSPAIGKITPRTYGIHLWNEVWRRENLDPAASHWPGSIFEQLRARYGEK